MSEKLERLTSELRQHCNENGIQFHAILYDENADSLVINGSMKEAVYTFATAEFFDKNPETYAAIMLKVLAKKIDLDTE